MIGDNEKANECFRKAIEQDDPWGYYNYAGNLWNGYGVNEDKVMAKELLTKATEMGLDEAQKLLGILLDNNDKKHTKDPTETKVASEPPTQNTVPKVTSNGISVVYDIPEPQTPMQTRKKRQILKQRRNGRNPLS